MRRGSRHAETRRRPCPPAPGEGVDPLDRLASRQLGEVGLGPPPHALGEHEHLHADVARHLRDPGLLLDPRFGPGLEQALRDGHPAVERALIGRSPSTLSGKHSVWPETRLFPPDRVSGIFSTIITSAEGSLSNASIAAQAPARPKPRTRTSASSSHCSTAASVAIVPPPWIAIRPVGPHCMTLHGVVC